MAWTKITKATGTVYTRATNVQGKQIYDEPSLTYDNSTALYDSINDAAWTKITKAAATVWTKITKAT